MRLRWWFGCVATLLGITGCPSEPAPLQAVPFGDGIYSPEATVCIDDTHAAVLVSYVGLQFARIRDPESAIVDPLITIAGSRADPTSYILQGPGRLYYSNRSDGLVHVVDISNVDDPFEIATAPEFPRGSIVSGAFVYTTDPLGIVAIDMTNPQSPQKGSVGKMFAPAPQIYTPSSGIPIGVFDGVLLAFGPAQIFVFDVADPLAPVELARLPWLDVSYYPTGWVVDGTRLYFSVSRTAHLPEFPGPGYDASIGVVDLTNPRAPEIVSPPTDGTMPRLIASHPRFGLFGVKAPPGIPFGHLFHIQPGEPPALGNEALAENTTQFDRVHNGCFAGNTLVLQTSMFTGFYTVRN